MTLFFSNSASGKRPPGVTPIGAADDPSPGLEVGPPRPACRRRSAVRNASEVTAAREGRRKDKTMTAAAGEPA